MQQNTFWLQLKRVPTPLALVVGLLLGLLIGKTLPTSVCLSIF
jgi:alpha-1,3-mannosyltransferase